MGARRKGNPGSPGAAREEKAGGPGDWEWPGSEGEGRPRAAGVSARASRKGREAPEDPPEKGGHPREERSWGSWGALECRTRGDLE